MAERGFLIPWYATVFRGDAFEEALQEIAPLALRYGASQYWIYRMQDDAYRFQQFSLFEDHHDFELLVRAGIRGLARRVLELVHDAGGLCADEARRHRAHRPGDQRQRCARRQPCSSGAIVSPASLSCSQ